MFTNSLKLIGLFLFQILLIFSIANADESTIEYKLANGGHKYECKVPTKGYGNQPFCDQDIVGLFASKFINASNFPCGSSVNLNETVTAYHGLFFELDHTQGIMHFVYHGNTEIKQFTKSRIAKSTLNMTYTIKNGNLIYTLPQDLQIETVRGFSLTGAKQLASPEDIERDIDQTIKTVCDDGTFSPFYTLINTVYVDEDKNSIINRINAKIVKQSVSHLFCNRLSDSDSDSENHCESRLIIPVMPDGIQAWNNIAVSGIAINIDKSRVLSHITFDFTPYMTGYKVKYKILIPYVVDANNNVKETAGIIETDSFIKNMITKD